MEIIIRNRNKIRGKNISEFARNLESVGWPSEFANEEVKDRVRFIERKENRPINKKDLRKISKQMSKQVE